MPALLLWGPDDPIFGDRYLDDLIDRLPHADVHRYEGAGHLVAEDRDYAAALLAWLGDNADRLGGSAAVSPRADAAAHVDRTRRRSGRSGAGSTSGGTIPTSRSSTCRLGDPEPPAA